MQDKTALSFWKTGKTQAHIMLPTFNISRGALKNLLKSVYKNQRVIWVQMFLFSSCSITQTDRLLWVGDKLLRELIRFYPWLCCEQCEDLSVFFFFYLRYLDLRLVLKRSLLSTSGPLIHTYIHTYTHTNIYISIIIKLDLCDIAFLCQASPPKALIVQYGSDGHSIIFMPVSNMVNKYIQKVD